MTKRLDSSLKPVGKGRPRFTRNGHPFTPEKTREFEAQLRTEWIMAGNTKPEEGPVNLYCVFRFSCPTSWSMRRQRAAIAGMDHPGKPDIDNLVKAVMDALTGYAWGDDKQVVLISAYKCYDVADGMTIRVERHQPDEQRQGDGDSTSFPSRRPAPATGS